jgi:hypothetical protein
MRTKQRGASLVELLASIAVLVVILPVLGMIVSDYFDLYQRNFAEISLTSQVPELQRTMVVDFTNMSRLVVAQPDAIVFRVAGCDDDGNPTIPFDRDGALLSYYLSDQTGDPDVDGSELWLARAPAGSWDLQPLQKVLSNVSSLQFQYLDVDGSAFSQEELDSASFDDATLSWVSVDLVAEHPGVSGLGAGQPAAVDANFRVAPRNNHD